MNQGKLAWTFAITTIALFMTALDNLVVVTALPRIQKDLHASLSSLEWTVNAYTLTFGVLLLTGAALGDRFGRKRMFILGLALFTGASAICALSHDVNLLVVGRALQGLGGAVVTPLTLTILSSDTPAEKRGAILGAWGGIAGLAVAVGPIVGGAIVSGIAWEWIFWLNVPIGVVAVVLSSIHLRETRGPFDKLDLPGLALAAGGLFAVVWGVVRASTLGWGAGEVLGCIAGGAAVLVVFVWWESRTRTPMLPLRFFRSRAFSLANVAAVAQYFGMFGSIFLLTQYMQNVLGYSPFGAGLRMLAWTGVTMVAAPVAGILSDRVGGGPLMALGLLCEAVALGWMAAISKTFLPFSHLVAPFILSGLGMGLFFAPVANVVLSSVRAEEEGQASGAHNALRELGGVFGVAVLAAIFASKGGYGPPHAQIFIDGLKPAIWVGTGIVAAGALLCLALPRPARARPEAEDVPSFAGMGSCVPMTIQHVEVRHETVVPVAEA